MTEKRYVEELWAYDDIMVKDTETGEELWNNMIYERMNEQDEQIKELEIELRNKTVKWEHELGMKLKYHSKLIDSEKENEQLKQAYQTLKHRHSLLHDECLETECDRNSLKKDVISLEKENENLNNVLEDFMVMLNRLQAEPDNKSLQIMAKDMLRMMGKDIMGDVE